MKLFLAVIISLVLGAGEVNAQDRALYWKYKDYDGAISFTVPAFAIDMASWFVKEKADRKLMRRVNKARILVFDGERSPVTKRDIDQFVARSQRLGLDELITVRDGQTHVRVLAQERKNTLRKVVVLVQEPDAFVLVTLKGRIRYEDINRVINRFGKDLKKKDDKPVVPEVVKVPVSRV
jgi:hypothetical protein